MGAALSYFEQFSSILFCRLNFEKVFKFLVETFTDFASCISGLTKLLNLSKLTVQLILLYFL